MQTVREQLVAALERLFLYVTDQDAFEAKHGASEFPDSSINVESWLDREVRGPVRLALDRARAEPEEKT